MNMPLIAIVFGILLDLAGTVSFFATGATHKTALIPCVFGMIILVCGIIARKEALLKHAMHVAAVFGVLGFLASAGRFVPSLIKQLNGGEPSPAALASTGSMALLCGVFTALCVKSFIDVRRARQAAQAGQASQG
ncbi:MAG: hypothetical protein SFU85_00935 [Candidatus Methylacidiphilales bacterium]|nr:hypothetical protein [Candidatus Methylacidiphilales bacterium]